MCAESLWGVRARFRRLKRDESAGESSAGSEPSVKTRVKSSVEPVWSERGASLERERSRVWNWMDRLVSGRSRVWS